MGSHGTSDPRISPPLQQQRGPTQQAPATSPDDLPSSWAGRRIKRISASVKKRIMIVNPKTRSSSSQRILFRKVSSPPSTLDRSRRVALRQIPVAHSAVVVRITKADRARGAPAHAAASEGRGRRGARDEGAQGRGRPVLLLLVVAVDRGRGRVRFFE